MDRKQAQHSPDAIRLLRGTQSRADFAKQVGVSPLTVYRWELPVGAAEARRPRGHLAARLATLADQGAVAAGQPASLPPTAPAITATALEPAEETALLPLLERLATGDLRRVEVELLTVLASGALRTLAGRALAGQALARIALLARADPCGAFTMLAPLVADLPQLPPAVQLEVQVTAALIFAWPDGRVFDAGRAHAHLAGAERLVPAYGTPDLRALLLIAEFTLALLQNETDKVTSALARLAELEQALESPAHRTLVREARAQAAAQAGRFAAAVELFAPVAAAGGLPLSRARAFAYLAAAAVQGGRAPREALAIIESAQTLARRERLQPGVHTMALDNMAGAALCRLGRLVDGAEVLEESIDLAEELRWSPAWPAITLAHIRVYTGRTDALRALGERLAAQRGAVAAGGTNALGMVLKAAADVLEGQQDGVRLYGALDRQLEMFESEVGWHDLRGEVLLFVGMVAARAGSPDQAARALRRAERHFERTPSIWAGALLRRTRGALWARQGRLHEARQVVESALGTLSLAEDAPNATHARLMVAQIDVALGVPGAREAAADLRAALEQLGYVFGLDDLADLPAPSDERSPAAPAASPYAPLDRLLAPIQRLASRGLGPAQIRRELVSVAGALVASPGDEVAVSLEELDSAGRTTPVLRQGAETVAVTEWVELGDGAGRRLRLGMGGVGIGREVRGPLSALAAVAELALELAMLRAVAGNPAPSEAAAAGADLPDLPGFVSVSGPMRQLKADLARLSRSRSTVIVTGESGSGKEVIARAIHDLSTRAGRPYIAFNCAAVPRDLFEGQLFGYRKGAFTGATADHPGVLRAADGGTVLLDEIGELPLDVQPKLLRFLENGEIHPLGERKPVRLDVRVVAATFRDLATLVRERQFREDLFYRLQVVALRVPPLRDRPEDVIALARHFLRMLTPSGSEPPVLAPDALAALSAYRWPGNVRELRNVIERSLAFAPLPPVLGAEHLRIAV